MIVDFRSVMMNISFVGIHMNLLECLNVTSFTIVVVRFRRTVDILCNPDAKRLYDDLLRKSGYNKLIRPVGNNTDKLTVKLGLRLSQLIDVVRWHFSDLMSFFGRSFI
jgi:hypothetical protein